MSSNHMLITEDYQKILSFLENKSVFMKNYVDQHFDSNYFMFYKYFTHSDLSNSGKRNGSHESIEKNFLYYLSVDEMNDIESQHGVVFESAKQSNIGVPHQFFTKLGIQRLDRRMGKQDSQHKHILINDYAKVYVVNDTLTNFNPDDTKKIMSLLDKKCNWEDHKLKFDLEVGPLTEISLTHAIHGIGTSKDINFSKLRMNIFKNDILTVLIEQKSDGEKIIFLMLEKNPIFYRLMGLSSQAWHKYSEQQLFIQETQLKEVAQTFIDDEKSRSFQSRWRLMIAEEMMNYSTSDGEVFCPFTYLRANFNELGTLFRASHIKAYSDCEDITEAFDINNGLLLCSNADALFDKHLITIDENKELLISFLLKSNQPLINNLLLTQPIFKLILNEKRMMYIKHHREIFFQLEKERRFNL